MLCDDFGDFLGGGSKLTQILHVDFFLFKKQLSKTQKVSFVSC